MKIFVIIDHWFPTIGGGPTHVAEIALLLKRRKKIDITIVTSKLSTGNFSEVPKKYGSLTVVKLGKRLPFETLRGRIFFMFSLFFFLLKEKFDILHVHPFSPILITKIIALIRQKPLIVTIHGIGKDIRGLGNRGFVVKTLQKINDYLTYRVRYNAQIFVRNDLKQKKNVNTKRFYIPNGVDIKAFDRVKTLKEKNFQILFTGRFEPEKNLISLLTAFNSISLNYPKTKLLLVGSGKQEKMLKKTIISLNLTSKVLIIPPLFGSNLIRKYKSSQVFILPSFYEAFPLTILEAWAAKIPVVSTNFGMIGEIIKHKKNGFIIAGTKPNDIERALIQMMRFKNLGRLGKNGYNLILKKYTWELVAEKTYQVYVQIQ